MISFAIRKYSLRLIFLALSFSFVLIFSGYYFYKNEKKAAGEEKYNELKSLTDLKIHQIVQWHKERLSEAGFFSGTIPYSQYVREITENKKKDEESYRNALKRIMTGGRYDQIFLLSKKGDLLFSVNPDFVFEDLATITYSQQVFSSGEIYIRDYYFCLKHQKIHYEIIAPVVDNHRVIAALVFRVNPKDYLTSVITDWPVMEKTAETFIFRKEGDSILFLNKPKASVDLTVHKERICLVQAISGYAGKYEGADYRGEKVLAEIQKIPGTSWYMVSKINAGEIYSDMNKRASLIVIIVFLAILFVVVSTAWVYNYRQRLIYKELYTKRVQLYQKDEELRATLYSIGEGVITTDSLGMVMQLNRVAEKITGWTEKEAAGKKIGEVFRIVDEKSRQSEENIANLVLKNEKTIGLTNHTVLVSRSGKEYPISHSASPIKSENGQVIGMVIVFRDQTEQRFKQKTLEESEQRFSQLFERAPLGYQSLDENGYFIEVNQAWLETMEYTKDEVIGKFFGDFLAPGYDDLFRENFSFFKKTGKIHSEFRMRHKNGEYKYISFEGRIGRKMDGSFDKTHCILQDITDKKRMEQQLLESEEKYRSIFQNHSAVKLIIDPESWEIVDTNEAASNFYGWSVEELKKMKISQINTLPEEEIRVQMERAKIQKNIRFEFKHRKADGSVVDVEVFSSKISIGEKEFLHSIIHDITKEKEAEQALRDSEERYRLILDNSIDAILLSTPDGKILSANQSACKMFGMTEEEICSAGWYGLADTSDARLKSLLEERDHSGKIKGELFFIRKDGTRFPAELTSSVFYNSKGEARASMIIRDITERKEMEEALYESEQIFSHFMENSPIYVFFKDKDIRAIRLSKNFEQMIGRPLPDIIGKTMDELFPSDLAKSMIADDKKVLDDGKMITVEEELNGRFYSTVKFPIHIDGKPQYLAGYTIDITDRKQMEENLRQSEEKIRLLFNSTAEGIYGLDMDGNCSFCNRAAIEILGYQNENELIGKNMHRLIHHSGHSGNVLSMDSCRIYIAFQKGFGAHADDEVLWKKNGESFPAEYWSYPIFSNGKVIGAVVTFLDITERKKAEETIKSNYKLLKIAGQSAKFGGWSLNIPEKRFSWSDEVAIIHEEPTGFSPTFQKGLSYYAPEYQKIISGVFARCSLEKTPFDEETEIITGKGNRVWVRLIGEPEKDSSGKVIKIHGSFQDITKIKTAEKKLHESRQSLSRLIDNLYGIAYRCNYSPEWTMEFISQGCLEIAGYTDKDFYNGRVSWGALINQEDREMVWNEITKSVKIGNPFQLEYRILHKDGREKWVWEKGSGVYNYNREIIALEGFITDISERHKAEEALRESEKYYRELIDGMIETVWIIDFDGSLIDINNTAVKDLGYTKEELLKIGLTGIDTSIGKDDIRALAKSMQKDKIQIFETAHQTKDGKIFPVEVYSSIVTYQGKEAILSIARNITRRKHDEEFQQILYEIARTSMSTKAIEDLLVVVRKELSKVLDTTNFYVALYDPETDKLKRVIFVNEKYDMEEWPAENSLSGDVIRTGKTLLINKEERTHFAKAHPHTGIPSKCWLGVPMLDDGKPIGVIVVQSYIDENAYDINSARLLEIVAHELSIVFQRKKMIQDLILAKEKAEESDRLKTAFLANISHEIRTPMNGILGFLDLLSKPNLNDDQKGKYLDIVNKSGQRLLNTINNIVEISKIESGQISVIPLDFNLSELMNFHYEFFKQQANLKGINLVLNEKITGEEALIHTDKHKLDGVITNLLNNAIKFTKKGSIELGNYRNEEFMVFYVKDSGIGIAPKMREAVFERFFQADFSLTRQYEGSGLGLSIVKAYILSLNGNIWVESEIGKGSTFFFTIPYIPAKGKSMISPRKNKTIHEIKNNIKILVAEDDEISFKFIEATLNSKVTIIHTVNGKDTVKAAKDHPDLSLILMDIKMPGMDGLEATGEIRKFNKTVPIIAQTAHAFTGDREKALKAGCNDYISKPVQRDLLISLINRYSHDLNR